MLQRVVQAFVALAIATSLFVPMAGAVPIAWSTPGDGLWQTAANWSSAPALPTFADDVTIDQPGALTVTLSSGAQTIRQLTAQEGLTISSGAELLVGVGGGTIAGPLSITSGRLTSQGGGTLIVNGTVNPGVASLRALAGSTLNVPGLTSINTANTVATNHSAQGAGSKLDLSSVTTFTGSASTSTTTVTAITGGRVEVENVPSITSGSVIFTADGALSVIDLTALTTVKSDNQFTRSHLQAVGGGTLITPNLTMIERTVVNVSSTSTINLAALTSANDSSFRALQGAHVVVPNLTNYVAGPGGTEFFSTSSGSNLDLSQITTMSGATSSSMTIATSDSGFLNLSGLTTITSGVVNLSASGNSVIDLSSLASYTASNSAQVRRFRAETGGTIHLRTGGSTTITNARVELEPTGHIDGDRLVLGADAVFAANGTLNADLTNLAGTVAVGAAPGTTTINGDFVQGVLGTTQVQIGGVTPGSQFDRLVVNGAAQLGGTLHVSPLSNFAPGPGNSFEVLTASGGISGTFNIVWTGSTPWRAVYDADSVTLVRGLSADFDGDLNVDGDDLLAWKGGFGTTTGATHAAGDADEDGDVDGYDFLRWQREVGLSAAVTATAAVPEPASVFLAGLVVATLGHRCRIRH